MYNWCYSCSLSVMYRVSSRAEASCKAETGGESWQRGRLAGMHTLRTAAAGSPSIAAGLVLHLPVQNIASTNDVTGAGPQHTAPCGNCFRLQTHASKS